MMDASTHRRLAALTVSSVSKPGSLQRSGRGSARGSRASSTSSTRMWW